MLIRAFVNIFFDGLLKRAGHFKPIIRKTSAFFYCYWENKKRMLAFDKLFRALQSLWAKWKF